VSDYIAAPLRARAPAAIDNLDTNCSLVRGGSSVTACPDGSSHWVDQS